ncbi:unnamed protein product [Oppiella nova]|uniref:Uncharacterized protein n=1 Tax=Oppiella nova TaxID=334625 RepID=A0A7R9Q935_9ACAR|nr:unnamed protein product [Oppiella nova]CAG2159790.1 unnamed protein product [Oppiella nova]
MLWWLWRMRYEMELVGIALKGTVLVPKFMVRNLLVSILLIIQTQLLSVGSRPTGHPYSYEQVIPEAQLLANDPHINCILHRTDKTGRQIVISNSFSIVMGLSVRTLWALPLDGKGYPGVMFCQTGK